VGGQIEIHNGGVFLKAQYLLSGTICIEYGTLFSEIRGGGGRLSAQANIVRPYPPEKLV
jgi:hypothetical protein